VEVPGCEIAGLHKPIGNVQPKTAGSGRLRFNAQNT
jgi:hypothetical protein